MLYVSVGLKGAVWGVAEDGTPMRRVGMDHNGEDDNMTPYGNGWETMNMLTVDGERQVGAANLRQLEVGDCQVFGTNDIHEIYRLQGCTTANPLGETWIQFGGTLRHVAVGQGPVLWGVDYAHQLWFQAIGDGRKDIDEDKQTYWREVEPQVMNMVQVSVGMNGYVWALGADGTVFWREGIVEDHKYGDSWTVVQSQLDATTTDNVAKEVAMCTNGHVWMIGTDDRLYYRMTIVTTQPGLDLIGSSWVLDESIATGAVSSITCGLEGQFAFIQEGQVVIKNEVTNDDPAGLSRGTTTLVEGELTWTDVSIGEQGQLYALSSEN
jgi:hypothetical protein